MSVDAKAILLVNPSDDSRALHADALRRAGFSVVSVADCELAVETLTRLRPRLIVASFDIHTREACLAFCERLAADEGDRTVPVLLTSTRIDRDDLRRATDLHVLTLVVAPLDGGKLTSAVQGVLAISEGRRSGPGPTDA